MPRSMGSIRSSAACEVERAASQDRARSAGARRAVVARAASRVGSLLACTLLLSAATAHAGNLSGAIAHDPGRLKPPVRNQGFVPRIENPLRPVKKLDAKPWLVVVLDGGPAAEEDSAPPEEPVRYDLVGESFDTRILPVVVGSRVELKNRGYKSPVLDTPEAPDLVSSVALEPRGTHVFQAGEALRPIVIRAQNAPHLQGTVVAFPHRYFSLVDRRGRFQIDNVPPGEWKLRVWYRDGWVKGVEETVQVGAKRSTVTVTIPARLEVEPPSGGQ